MRVPVEYDPFNAETPMSALGQVPTPDGVFFVRNHFAAPELSGAEHRLLLQEGFESPLALSLAQIQALPKRTLLVTLECAGNGRTAIEPLPPGTPWAVGAVGTAHFGGAALCDVLRAARPRAETREILFRGADRGEVEKGRVESYERSLPLQQALRADTLLCYEMNGRPLPREHGFPLRLIVPGWYGVASVKWLTQISALSEPFRGFYQYDRYVYLGEAGVADYTPLARMRPRALIALPLDQATIRAGLIEVRGTAWSGEAPLQRVDVSVDEGRTWEPVELDPSDSAYAARAWCFRWRATSGRYTLMVRARDQAGGAQPLESCKNVLGYGNNVVQRVRVTVV